MFATSVANAMLQAQENLQDGTLGIGIEICMWTNTIVHDGRCCAAKRSH